MPRSGLRLRFAATALLGVVLGVALSGCGALPFTERPASGYVYRSGQPLRVLVVDETGGDDWRAAVEAAAQRYDVASPYLEFVPDPGSVHITITIRRYRDESPPELQGYAFQAGVGGFATVYDTQGIACNYPPSSLPLNCSGEIARAEIYLNDVIPAGADIAERRERLLLHELGHALGLTRHSPDLGIGQLAARYGWPSS